MAGKLKSKIVVSDESSEDEKGVENELDLPLEKLNLGPKKKLLVLSLGGILAHRVHVRDKHTVRGLKPDVTYGKFLVFKRPFCTDFMKFCFERFVVGLWSSARDQNIDAVLSCITGPGMRSKLVVDGGGGTKRTYPNPPLYFNKTVQAFFTKMAKNSAGSSKTAGKPIRCRAAVVRKAGEPLVIEEIIVAPPRSAEVRIKIICTSLCHSDVTFWKLKDPSGYVTRILGHEAVGIVESVGEDVQEFSKGDTVIPIFLLDCSECTDCTSKKSNLCSKFPFKVSPWLHRDGTSRFTDLKGETLYHFLFVSSFSEYTVLNTANVTKVDPAISPNRACLLSCGVSTAFVWGQEECTESGFYCLRKEEKPLFLKNLKDLWEKKYRSLPWEKGQYSSSNTLLMDDEPHTCLLNPHDTAIFPQPYKKLDLKDTVLGPNGELQGFLEGLVDADDVPTYVKKHRIGQPAITPSHPDWSYYAKIVRHFGKKEKDGE